MRLHSRAAIGVFDSGVGGLTVLRALMARLPNESTLYLGDTARVPYGTKSGEVVTRYSLANARFLLEREIKLLVVACNTASAVALPALSRALPVPVIGVIEPGARAAAARTRTGRVGVIGTPGTVSSGAYQRALEQARPGSFVRARACPLFVPLAEEGWTHGEVPMLVAREYLSDMREAGVDTLVLGCTHYPLLHGIIAEVMGPGVGLVDSAEAVAEAVEAQLRASQLLSPGDRPPSHAYFVTDVPHRFLEVGARFLGRTLPHAEQVDIVPI
jgi:glutamate racemase